MIFFQDVMKNVNYSEKLEQLHCEHHSTEHLASIFNILLYLTYHEPIHNLPNLLSINFILWVHFKTDCRC